MPQYSRLIAVAALVLMAAGCATFQPKPILEQEVLRALQTIQLDALRPTVEEQRKRQSKESKVFNAENGLSSDEAVAVALFLNPDLRAFRKERGIAEGELITAGLLPNPELQVTWLNIDHFTRSLGTTGLDIGLIWAPLRPGERGLKRANARARIEEVRAQIMGEEWRLAAEVRKAYVTLWAVEERLRLTEALLRLQERIRAFVRDKRALGDASRLDLNLVQIAYVDALRERETIRNEQNQARQALNRLLGLPPLYEVKLEKTGEPFTYRAYSLKPEVLESTMLEWRSDLRATKHAYEQTEHSLHLAYLQRLPWFRFGPAFARDELDDKARNRWGIGLGIDLPLANLNQGEIARLEAIRDKFRETFIAIVHHARAEVTAAYRNLLAQERLIRFFKESVQPALDENTELTEAGLEMGEFNLLQLITTQDKVIKSRREFLDTQLEYWKAVFDLEQALGTRLSEAAMTIENPATH